MKILHIIAEAWFAKVPLAATRADGARQYVTDAAAIVLGVTSSLVFDLKWF